MSCCTDDNQTRFQDIFFQATEKDNNSRKAEGNKYWGCWRGEYVYIGVCDREQFRRASIFLSILLYVWATSFRWGFSGFTIKDYSSFHLSLITVIKIWKRNRNRFCFRNSKTCYLYLNLVLTDDILINHRLFR